MATLTIRNLDEDLKRKLRIRGAEHNRSMEAEARDILQKALRSSNAKTGMASMIREIIAPTGGIDLKLPDRSDDDSDRRIPDFREM